VYEVRETTTIQITTELRNKLTAFKLVDREPYQDVIKRIIKNYARNK